VPFWSLADPPRSSVLLDLLHLFFNCPLPTHHEGTDEQALQCTGLIDGSSTEPKELFEGVREFPEGIPVDELSAISESWIGRVRWAVARDWQYYHINFSF
jgi:hypothetical protein